MTLWGGRFSESPADVAWAFTTDESDRRLLGDDVEGSIAHVTMLGDVGLLAPDEVAALRHGLEQIRHEWVDGSFVFVAGDEDVHTAVERRLGELVGAVAGKLHTGRSRNDQVATDLRLYLRRSGMVRVAQLQELVAALADAAERADGIVTAAYTHLQQAQAIPLAHHLLAYAWMVLRDVDRLGGVLERLDESPLGAGAVAGSSLPLDPARSAELLGFTSVFANSMDAVSSRDVAAEYAFCCAQAMTHLSRLGEDLVLWATDEFAVADYGDAFTTGSSALPQKRNPDVAELARGKAAGVIGDVAGLLALQKGLPLSYNRDLQEDKRMVFHADDVLSLAVPALTGMLAGATFSAPEVSPWVTALDLAEALTRRGVPFREAHESVGRLVQHLIADGRALDAATADDLLAVDDRFALADLDVLAPAASVSRRTAAGAASPSSVDAQLAAVRARIT